MECRPEEISALLDGELSPDRRAELRAHLGLCFDCASLARRLRESDAALRARVVPFPGGLRSRLRAAAGPPRALRWVRASRAAAALLVTGAAAWLAARTFPEFLRDREIPSDPLTTYATQQAWLDALELEAASFRLDLEMGAIPPEERARLEETAKSVFDRLRQLRDESRELVASAGGTATVSQDEKEKQR